MISLPIQIVRMKLRSWKSYIIAMLVLFSLSWYFTSTTRVTSTAALSQSLILNQTSITTTSRDIARNMLRSASSMMTKKLAPSYDKHWRAGRIEPDQMKPFVPLERDDVDDMTNIIFNKSANALCNDVDRYISMPPTVFDGRRLGNQLFNFAAMLHIGRLCGRRVAMVHEHPDGCWKYTVGIERQLRRQLTPKKILSDAVDNYLKTITPTGWTKRSTNENEVGFVRIGIHVRTMDISSTESLDFGYTIPRRQYFRAAMRSLVERYLSPQSNLPNGKRSRCFQFVVASDYIDFCRERIGFDKFRDWLSDFKLPPYQLNLVYSEKNAAGFDLVMLSRCDALIITTGSFSWWAAWLANKTTIYYENWPRVNSTLSYQFNREDFFPPSWIPLGGPYYRFGLKKQTIDSTNTTKTS